MHATFADSVFERIFGAEARRALRIALLTREPKIRLLGPGHEWGGRTRLARRAARRVDVLVWQPSTRFVYSAIMGPPDIHVLVPSARAVAGTVLWAQAGRLHLTVAVKATFAFAPEGPMNSLPPEPFAAEDAFDAGPVPVLLRPSDLAPRKVRTDVFFGGHAHPPRGAAVSAMAVHVVVARGDLALVEKTLWIRSSGASLGPTPLTYRSALGGPGWADNPAGVGAPGAAGVPTILDPEDPTRTARFGPVAPDWPARRRLLGSLEAGALAAPVVEYPADFDFGYFQAAPADQQCEALRGDEWLVLEGLHPAIPGIRSYLPGAQGRAWLYDAAGGAPVPIELVADTLSIDGDRQSCSVVWRGHRALAAPPAPGALRVLADVELLRKPVIAPPVWPGAPAPVAAPPVRVPVEPVAGPPASSPKAKAPPAPTPVEEDEPVFAGTVVLSDAQQVGAARAPAVPFAPASPWAASKPSAAAAAASGPPPSEPRSAAERPPASAGSEPATEDLSPLMGTMVLGHTAHPSSARRAVTPFAPVHVAAVPVTPRSSGLPTSGASPRLPTFMQAPPPLKDPSPFVPAPAALSTEPISGPAAAAAAPDPGSAPARREEQPLPDARVADTVPVVTTDKLSCMTMIWQVTPPASTLCVIIKGTFDIVPGEPAIWSEEPEVLMGDVHTDDDPEKGLLYPSDFAPYKPRADVTLRGHACGDGVRSTMEVRFRFGRPPRGFDRALVVQGDRKGGRVDALVARPAPIKRIPLVWERAFGGPDIPENPVGVGGDASRLPNIQDADILHPSRGADRGPAGFGPISPRWPARRSEMGTYDAGWLRERWPYLPKDFDFGAFQAAPSPQQIEHLEGTESFELVGMRPDHSVLGGKLPGVRVRAFAQRTPSAGAELVEIALRLDTASFDVDAMRVMLVWRGLLAVRDEDASELLDVFVLSEEAGSKPLSKEVVRERYLEARSDPPEPPSLISEDEQDEARAAEEAARREREEHDGEIDRLLAELESAPAEASVATKPRKRGEQAPREKRVKPRSELEAMVARLRKQGASKDDIAGVLRGLRSPPVKPAAKDADLRALAEGMLERGEAFDDVDLAGADLSGLDFHGRSMKRVNLKEAKLEGCALGEARLDGAQLSGADLRGASLVGARLDEADLSRANLEGANLADCQLDGADLSEVRAMKSSFTRSSGDGARFTKADVSGARFDGADLPNADFTEARLGGASLEGATLTDVRLYGAEGEECRFNGARMENARVDDARLTRASFRDVHAQGSVWDGAALDQCIFHGAALAGAAFVKATCRKAVFAAADLTEARLSRADLSGASFLEANLLKADLERANLTAADLRAANLHGAELWKAKLEGAMLEEAILSKTKLAGGRA